MSQSSVNKHIIGEDADGQRIDNYLFKLLKALPKSRIYRALRSGEVRVNGGRIKPEYKLAVGDELRLPPWQGAVKPAQRLAPDQKLRNELEERILYEDEHVIAINKPAGMPVHGGSKANSGVVEWLRLLRPKVKRLELVHRLDRDTSGVLLLAKKRADLLQLQQQFADRTVKKQYQTVVFGQVDFKRKRVDAKLLRLQNNDGARKVVVSAKGKTALTEFRVEQVGQQISLLSVNLFTGRMHQIRVHCQHLGLAIVGDPRYGNWGVNRWLARRGCGRMLLHAAKLNIDVAGVKHEFEAPLDEEFRSIFQYDGRIRVD